jgi:hypothetical protein
MIKFSRKNKLLHKANLILVNDWLLRITAANFIMNFNSTVYFKNLNVTRIYKSFLPCKLIN